MIDENYKTALQQEYLNTEEQNILKEIEEIKFNERGFN